MGRRHTGLDADRLVEVGNGTVKIALAAPGDATVDERAHELRIDLDRLIEVGNRPFVAPLLVPHQTALVVGIGVRKPQSDGAIEVDQCAIEIAMSPPQDASIAEYGGVVRMDADRGLVVCSARSWSPLLLPVTATLSSLATAPSALTTASLPTASASSRTRRSCAR